MLVSLSNEAGQGIDDNGVWLELCKDLVDLEQVHLQAKNEGLVDTILSKRFFTNGVKSMPMEFMF